MPIAGPVQFTCSQLGGHIESAAQLAFRPQSATPQQICYETEEIPTSSLLPRNIKQNGMLPQVLAIIKTALQEHGYNTDVESRSDLSQIEDWQLPYVRFYKCKNGEAVVLHTDNMTQLQANWAGIEKTAKKIARLQDISPDDKHLF